MILPGHGLGRDTDVIGGYSAFGLGRLIITSGNIVTGSIAFGANFDFSVLEQKEINITILFNTELDKNIATQLGRYSQIQFNTELDEDIATQLDYYPTVQFNADMDIDLIKQTDTNVFIQFNADLDLTVQEFLIGFTLVPLYLYEIPEEIRVLKVSQEVRSIEILPYNRGIKIYFEDRTVVIPPKLEE